jgi:hypothetical protein
LEIIMADVSPEMLNVESLLAETQFAIGVYVAGLEPEDPSGGRSEKPWAVEEAGVSVSFDWIKTMRKPAYCPELLSKAWKMKALTGSFIGFDFLHCPIMA